jgi:hypothetical protein
LTRLSTRKIRRETLTVLAFRSYFSRALAPEVLRQRFKNFETKFLNELQLNINHQVQNLHLENIKISTKAGLTTSAIDTPINKKNKARDFNSLDI